MQNAIGSIPTPKGKWTSWTQSLQARIGATIQRAEEQVEHQQVVHTLEETSRSHINAPVRQREEHMKHDCKTSRP
eukprot:12905963-Prorocentrum_lima.AAC.1